MAEARKNKRTWFEEGYGRPKGAAEQRVEYISITYRSMASDKLKRALMQLENLAEDGELRAGYKDRAEKTQLEDQEAPQRHVRGCCPSAPRLLGSWGGERCLPAVRSGAA